MRNRLSKKAAAWLLFVFAVIQHSAIAQEEQNDEKLKVFIDCNSCDVSFIKQEINYLAYVRDRLLSDVHIQILSQNTGSGGEEYTYFFYGQNDFANQNDTLIITVDVNQTSDEIRRLQLKNLQLGLVPYLLKKGYLDHLDLTVSGFDQEEKEDEVDPWRNWVFSIDGGSWFNGQETYNSTSFNASVEANKITEKAKIESDLGFYYNLEQFKIDDEIIKSETRSQYGSYSYVHSLNQHWSSGIFLSGNSSLYNNYKIQLDLSPGIEYNIFPYSESTKRQIRCTYKLGGRYVHYNDTTVYNKIEEELYFESLGVAAKFKEKWGSISTSIRGSHYFHDLQLNSLNFGLNIRLRLLKGLTWRVGGNLRLIHDQLSLPRTGATAEEILLQQRQLQTGYRYWGNMGLTYTFGSIYNNVVNPRFGN